MSNSARNMYALSIDQCVNLIASIGKKRTVIVEGPMGTGKTTGIKNGLKKKFPDHIHVEFDCTNKDIQDLSAPKFMQKLEGMVSDYVSFVPNEELGVHHGKPIILNFDEIAKALEPVKKAVRRVMLERMINTLKLHPDSIVYGTTNLAQEGLGDMFQAHQRNAVIMVQSRQPTTEEYLDYGINNGFDPSLLGFVKDTPALAMTFLDFKNPEDNIYGHDPRKASSGAFWTNRSGEIASDILKQRNNMDDTTLTQALMGAVGDRCAMDLMTYVKLADQMPKRDDILNDPKNAKIPTSASAVVMVVFRSLTGMDKKYIDPFMEYLVRLDQEAQGMFANGVRNPKYHAQQLVMTNKKFTEWAMKNNYMFSADKK